MLLFNNVKDYVKDYTRERLAYYSSLLFTRNAHNNFFRYRDCRTFQYIKVMLKSRPGPRDELLITLVLMS